MSKRLVTKNKSLRDYFIIAYLIPIAATVLATLKDGMPTGLVTNQLDAWAMVVFLSMVHAPTIAAMIVAFRDEGFEGIKDLFRQLKYWRFKIKWYLLALLIFPLLIFTALLLLSLFSQRFSPAFSISILILGTFISALLEEIGWIGYAAPRMLKRFSVLKTGIFLGIIHAFWHLAAGIWGAGTFYGQLYAISFLLSVVSLIILRIFILWVYIRTKSLVLSWLTHFSWTGGQLLLTVTLSAVDTLLWNSTFILLLFLVLAFLFIRNKDFRDFWNSGFNIASLTQVGGII
jgi:membrane protease YdiL (CAAX protease family)